MNGRSLRRRGSAGGFASRLISVVVLGAMGVPMVMVLVMVMGGLVARPVGHIVKVDDTVGGGIRAPAIPAIVLLCVRARHGAANRFLSHRLDMQFHACDGLQPHWIWLWSSGHGCGGIGPVDGVGRRKHLDTHATEMEEPLEGLDSLLGHKTVSEVHVGGAELLLAVGEHASGLIRAPSTILHVVGAELCSEAASQDALSFRSSCLSALVTGVGVGLSCDLGRALGHGGKSLNVRNRDSHGACHIDGRHSLSSCLFFLFRLVVDDQ